MTRNQSIELLNEVSLGEDIGIGGYVASAAYKLANRDISIDTLAAHVDADVLTALGSEPLEFEEIEALEE